MRSVREIIEREDKTGERHHGQPCLEWDHFVGAKVYQLVWPRRLQKRKLVFRPQNVPLLAFLFDSRCLRKHEPDIGPARPHKAFLFHFRLAILGTCFMECVTALPDCCCGAPLLITRARTATYSHIHPVDLFLRAPPTLLTGKPSIIHTPPPTPLQSDIKKSVSEDTESVKQLHDWNAKYGEGAKSKSRPGIGFVAPPPQSIESSDAPMRTRVREAMSG